MAIAVPITFDIQFDFDAFEAMVLSDLKPDEDKLLQGLQLAAERIAGTWQSAVSGRILPGMSRAIHDETYRNSIQVGDVGSLRENNLYVDIFTDYEHAEDIETGKPAWDMKPGLLDGPNAKEGEDGDRYNVIPFRHGTPQAGGAPRPHFSSTMPENVYRRALKDKPINPNYGKRSKVAVLIDPSRRVMLNNYTWKAGLYQGLKRISHQYESVTQSTYMTFRTVSDKSDPDSWMYPATPANEIRRAVMEAVRPDLQQIFESVFR